ncbi:hypothetical protein ABTZ59_33250 [Streptomyces sp. NPDC094034]|uniref:hypothetical protein n=1 Tax=Streptomyces sp. NPDC094034 TaxID=3155309 RepID=UPI00332A1CDB
MRRAISVLSAVFAMLIGGIAFAPTASAAGYGCSGNLIDSYDVRTDGGTKWGVAYLYYSTANGGTNCAAVVDTYWGTGTTKLMVANIWRCTAGTQPGGTCYIDQQSHDDGYYTSYAGPVSVTGTANRCIHVDGTIWNPSRTTAASVSVNAVHC